MIRVRSGFVRAAPSGVQVLDAATGALLTSDAIPTDAPPVDLQLVGHGCGAADLNGDGFVDASDLADLLGAWGPCPEPPEPCPADIFGSGDGFVSADDLAGLLGAWGPCD